MRCAFNKIVKKILDTDQFNYVVSKRLIELARIYLGRPVVDLNTGQIYSTAKDVARAMGVADTVGGYIKTKSKCRGHYFQYKDVVDKSSIEVELQKMIDNAKQGRQRIIDSVARSITNIDTGQVFDTGYDADRSIDVLLGSVRATIQVYTKKDKRKCGVLRGYRWQFTDVVDQYGGIDKYRDVLDNIEKEKDKIVEGKYVVNLNTGEMYKTSADAVRAYYNDKLPDKVDLYIVNRSIKLHQKSLGRVWAYKKDVDECGIQCLLDQYEQHVRDIKAKRTAASRAKSNRPVINLVDGTVYESGTIASKAFGRCKAWCQGQIANNRIKPEYHFMYYDEYLKIKQKENE